MIELILIDIDGTMTDGKLYYSDSSVAESFKSFNVKDGLALSCWNKMGKKSAFITGRDSIATQNRAKELGVEFVFCGVSDKGVVIDRLTQELNIKKENIASIGDDLNDLVMFARSSLSFAPKDCSSFVKNKVDIVLNSNGGCGAVREMIEFILKRDGIEDRLLEFFI